MTIELDTTLAQAEVLFLSFAQLAADIDRQAAEAQSASALRKRKTASKADEVTPNEAEAKASGVAVRAKVPELSADLRELLKTGR
jgi:TBC1 domain family member 15